MIKRQTPSQTIGPFFAQALTPKQHGHSILSSIPSGSLIKTGTSGIPINIEGRIFDGAGIVVTDALVEIWQADSFGQYPNSRGTKPSDNIFTGFGRVDTGTDERNRFIFNTIKPGLIGDGQAPHINVIVFMRGLLSHVFTRIYFSDEVLANASDPVLLSVPKHRRVTLISVLEEKTSPSSYHFDIHLQGEQETIFFDA